MTNNSNTNKSVKEIHDEVSRLGESHDLTKQLYRKAAPRTDLAVRAHFEHTLSSIEGAAELSEDEFEVILQGAMKRARSSEIASEVLFAYDRPRWYLNLLATGLAVVGVQTAVAHGREWFETRESDVAGRGNPFADASSAGPRPLNRSRSKESAVSAALN